VDLHDWDIDYEELIRGAQTLQDKRNCIGNGISDLATGLHKS
jgi:hypothetical protein